MDNDQKYTGDTSIATELPITFQTLSGETVSATLKKINVQSFEPSFECQMYIEVSAQTYQDMIDNEWFNLFANMRNGSSASMEADKPVEVQLALRSSMTKLAVQHAFDAEHVFDCLRPSTELAQSLLRLDHTECWLALELKQSVELPEALKDSGVLKVGIRTAWLNSTDQSDHAEENETLLEHMEHFLTSKALKYESIDDQLIKLSFKGDNESWIGLIRIEEERQYCAIYSVYPELVPSHQRAELALLLINENIDLAYGNFELDNEDGELRFRTSYYCGKSFDYEGFEQLMVEHLQTADHYFHEIREMLLR